MVLFKFTCLWCGHVVLNTRKFNEPPCPKCGKPMTFLKTMSFTREEIYHLVEMRR